MPIYERDPWRRAYFESVACPDHVHIPTDDGDAYRLNVAHRFVYNKLFVAESQGLACAPHGIVPDHFPVFSKPIVNLDGMGLGSRVLRDASDYERHCQPGHMWMTLLEGEHRSSDVVVIDGQALWFRHAHGLPLREGMFDYWVVEARAHSELEDYCGRWITRHLQGYTGMANFESVGGRIIEIHLRFTDQWPDLCGVGWVEAVVRVYAEKRWQFADADRRDGFSVALFGSHGHRFSHPAPDVLGPIRAIPGVSSVQITFHDDRPAANQAMPPGGFRLAVVNAWDLSAGLAARTQLARAFGLPAADTCLRHA